MCPTVLGIFLDPVLLFSSSLWSNFLLLFTGKLIKDFVVLFELVPCTVLWFLWNCRFNSFPVHIHPVLLFDGSLKTNSTAL